jgi:hypothetical protein
MGARCCGGSRDAGGVYLEVGLSPYGRLLEDFLIDPPIPVPADMNLTALGWNYFTRGETVHIIDVIGQDNYSTPTRWLEETRRLGVSRRARRDDPHLKLLTPDSMIFMVHARGWVSNWADYYRAWAAEQPGAPEGSDEVTERLDWPCPKRIMNHRFPSPEDLAGQCCAGFWWQDEDEPHGKVGDPQWVEAAPNLHELTTQRAVYVHIPCGRYMAWSRPAGLVPEYRPAFIARFMPTRFVVVAAPDGSHEETAARLRENLQAFTVDVVPE